MAASVINVSASLSRNRVALDAAPVPEVHFDRSLVGQGVPRRRNARIADDVVPAAAHRLGEGTKAEGVARIPQYVVAVLVVMPQGPYFAAWLCLQLWAVDGGRWRVIGAQQSVRSGGEIELACAEVVELAADRFRGGAHQALCGWQLFMV
jgi:hypothetical protein